MNHFVLTRANISSKNTPRGGIGWSKIIHILKFDKFCPISKNTTDKLYFQQYWNWSIVFQRKGFETELFGFIPKHHY